MSGDQVLVLADLCKATVAAEDVWSGIAQLYPVNTYEAQLVSEVANETLTWLSFSISSNLFETLFATK